MKKKYEKPHLTVGEQLELLRQRGLGIVDEARCLEALNGIGYYRLSAYWYPLRTFKPRQKRKSRWNYREDRFQANRTFDDVLALYGFDEKLRSLLFEALEAIEIQLRACIADRAGAVDPYIHLRRHLLDRKACDLVPRGNGSTSYELWEKRYREQLRRARNEDFLRHFNHTYLGELPIWIAAEVLDFGSISKLFDYLPKKTKNEISIQFGVLQGSIASSWFRNFNYVRNLTAHHSRVWNRALVTRVQPPNPNVVDQGIFHLSRKVGTSDFSKIYPTMALLIYVLSFICPKEDWRERFIELMNQFPQIPHTCPETDMGFPEGWRNIGLWNPRVEFESGAAMPPWTPELSQAVTAKLRD